MFGLSWLPTLVISVSYPPLESLIGTAAVFPLILLGVASIVFLYFYLPETKGRRIHEIAHIWKKQQPAAAAVMNGEVCETTPLLAMSNNNLY